MDKISKAPVAAPIQADFGWVTWFGQHGDATNNLITFAPYVNVLEYGAKGDGTTDDTLAIQAALNDVSENSGVFFPYGANGEYRITNTLTLRKNNVSLFGLPNGSITIHLDDSGQTKENLYIGDDSTLYSNIAVRDLKFSREQAVSSTSTPCIKMRYLKTVTLENLNMYGNGYLGQGINGQRIVNCHVTNCRFQTPLGTALRFVGTGTTNSTVVEEVYVTRCWFYSCGNNAISFGDYCQKVHINNCDIFNSTSTAIALNPTNGLSNFEISDCVDRDSATSIYVTNVDYVNITGCRLIPLTGNGISILDSDNLIITGNLINSLGDGINISPATQADNIVITGNNITGASSDGIYINANAANLVITGNMIQNCGAYGIDKTSAPDAVTIVGNHFKGNTTGNISANGTNLNVANNNLL